METRKLSRPALILTALLLGQAAIFYGFSRSEKPVEYRPLDQFPLQLGPWRMAQEGVMEQEIKDVLRADDYINRFYFDADHKRLASLFVAFFKTQRQGQAPHSPKNCLPGSGWVWTISDTLPLRVPTRTDPIVVNRYIVQKGDQKSLVLYWYQSRNRIVASEYAAKAYAIADALRYNRTDTALVRVVVPVVGKDDGNALETAEAFTSAFYPTLTSFLPK